jgi:hypothetical protein
VVAAELGVEEINGGAELPWRRTPSKFRRPRAQSRWRKGLGDRGEGGEATEVLNSSRGSRYL